MLSFALAALSKFVLFVMEVHLEQRRESRAIAGLRSFKSVSEREISTTAFPYWFDQSAMVKRPCAGFGRVF
jgi:hypothetical protein